MAAPEHKCHLLQEVSLIGRPQPWALPPTLSHSGAGPVLSPCSPSSEAPTIATQPPPPVAGTESAPEGDRSLPNERAPRIFTTKRLRLRWEFAFVSEQRPGASPLHGLPQQHPTWSCLAPAQASDRPQEDMGPRPLTPAQPSTPDCHPGSE